jgi:hypothetical protein
MAAALNEPLPTRSQRSDYQPAVPKRTLAVIRTRGTTQRELRAFEFVNWRQPEARCQLITLESIPPKEYLPEGLEWCLASRSLLSKDED